MPDMKVDPRYLTEEGPQIFTGNELLLKGALETEGGVHLLGGYPSSPNAGFFDSMTLIKDLLIEKGIRAIMNHNEALAAAMLNGSQTLPVRAMIAIKSVGVHVAADALALGSLAGPHPDGGAIVVYGDDPWSDSTQVPADSRYISRHLYIPIIEPSDGQEVKDFVDLAFKLSRRGGVFVGYIVTTNLADGGGSVQCRPNQYPKLNMRQRVDLETAAIDLDKRVLLPPRTWWQEASYTSRFDKVKAVARKLGLNRIDYPCQGRKPVGFVTSGLAHGYLVQALYEMNMLGELPILKLGLSYPVDEAMIRRLAQMCERIVVVEERRGFMEGQISEIMLRNRQSGAPSSDCQLWGKRFPFDLPGIPDIRGLHPSIIISRLAPLLKAVDGASTRITVPAEYESLDREVETIDSTGTAEVGSLPIRTATFCPGCPHRDSASLCLEIKKRFMDGQYMRRTHGRGPVDLIFHGDTGCYTMLMFPPTVPLMHDYSGMGLGAGTGSGIDPFTVNKKVVFMGDGTFFHSGQLAISQAVKIGQDITFIILDNATTAMTGHQPTAGVAYDIIGNPTPTQDIEEVVAAMGGDGGMSVVRVDPEKRKQYARLLEETFLADGVKVILADKECGITRTRRRRRQERATVRRLGYLPSREYTNINQEVCTFCMACAEMTGCAGLTHTSTDYGPKMDTDITWCVNDGACERIGACSSFERIVVKRKRPPRSRVPELGLDDIPEPQKRPVGDIWRAFLVGVGCMGVGTATQVLVRAAYKEGYPVIFLDKKGLAIRNGGVTSQVVFNITNKPVTAVVPYGKADLLVGLDILEAARSLDPTGRARIASPEKTAAVINTDKFRTIPGLMGQVDYDVDQLERTIRQYTRNDDYLARNISRICQKYLGSKIYANIMMLGFAFQKGLIPVSMHSMAWAIKDTIRVAFRKNLYAFNMGRKLVVQPDLFLGAPQRNRWADTLEEKCRQTIRRYRGGSDLADELRQVAARTMEAVNELDESLKRDIVIRLYDCLRWGGLSYGQRYANGVTSVYASDCADENYAATRAVAHNLAAAMLIKDAVFIAELSTSPEKYARDRNKYNVNRANGDSIRYYHRWHMKFGFGRWQLPIDVTLRPWMCKALRRMRFLRKLLPGWHKSDRMHLEQYERQIAAFGADPTQYGASLARLSSPSCIKCANPGCSERGCPLHSQVPKWVQLACTGRWREASEVLHDTNNFPEFTSRICPAPCQVTCKQSAGGYPVGIRDIEGEIIERALTGGWVVPKPSADKTGFSVAIIGSGPAGLAAAQQLARAGHNVTIFEKDDDVGGLLRHGIPDHRLGGEIIDRRIEQLRGEGVTFRTGIEVGPDISGRELRSRFDAICLTSGARRPRDLHIPGRDKAGICFAMDMLLGNAPAVGGKVVAVIGGGETGNDCVETALRAGASKVHQLEILPAAGDATFAARSDTVRRRYCVATKAFGGDGALDELIAVEVKWSASPQGPVMCELAGTEFKVKADLAVVALGYDAVVEENLAEQLGLDSDDGRITLRDFATQVQGIFAAGDLATGASFVADAIATGRKVAEKIDTYLAGLPSPRKH